MEIMTGWGGKKILLWDTTGRPVGRVGGFIRGRRDAGRTAQPWSDCVLLALKEV